MTDPTSNGANDPRSRSKVLLDGRDRAPARAMLRAVGFSDDDFQRPLIGVANTWTEATPCNAHLRGMRSGYAYAKSFRTVKTCVGSEFCRYGLGDSTRLGIEIEERFKGLESPAKLKLGVAGCPRNCSEALIKDVGVVAVDGGRWEIYVGGAGGAHVRRGDLLCVVDTHEEVLRYTGRFLQYYREHARYLERTYAFVPRLGIDVIRATVVQDAEGLAGSLDAAMDASIDAYRDPWQEAAEPVHESQFATLLTTG